MAFAEEHKFPPGLLPNLKNVPDTINRRMVTYDRFGCRWQTSSDHGHVAFCEGRHYFIHHDPAQSGVDGP